MKGNWLYWNWKEGEEENLAVERRVVMAMAASAEDKMGTFKGNMPDEKCPLLWGEALWATPHTHGKGARAAHERMQGARAQACL